MKIFLFFLFFLSFSFMGCEFQSDSIKSNITQAQHLATKELKIKDQTFTVEIAKTQQERQIGLMYRKKMDKHKGMLFIFPKKDYHSFWMKNTFIPLDIAWIDDDGTIVDIQKMEPCINKVCRFYIPKSKAKFVLEINKDKLKSQIGDKVIFPNNF